MSDITGNPFGVRRAGPADIDALLLFVPQVLQETSLLPLSSEKLEACIERCAHQRSGAIAGVIDGPEGQIDASVGLAFAESETSDVPYVNAIWCGLHPSIRRHPGDDGPKAHYGRRLFEFAKWCHGILEATAGHPVLMRFDLLTRHYLGPKVRLYQRNLEQVGASFAFGATGEFASQSEVDGNLGAPYARTPTPWRRSTIEAWQEQQARWARGSAKQRRAKGE